MTTATVTQDDIEQTIRKGRLDEYFVGTLNWDYPDTYEPYPISITKPGDSEAAPDVFQLTPVVEKRGIVLFQCSPGEDGEVPGATMRRAIDKHLTGYAHEHLIVFHDDSWRHQVWQYTDREPGKPLRPRVAEMHPNQSGEAVRQLLSRLAFDIEADEDELTLVDVLNRVKQGIPADNVTKKFYREFSTHRNAFEQFIEGIEEQGDREWYASIMLNRLMFIWFVQAKGFLDNDPDYLVNRFNTITQRHPRDGTAFMSFYRAFLQKLFDDGLDTPITQRTPEIVELLGDVPYLNGGIFDRHELERANEIDIPDQAFAELFAFFGQYQWHLDNRPLRNDREINPDVIGYIFEQFVNQKEMGAYYTKEDVTGYISQNTILPWILDQARKECAIAFRADEADNVWTLPRRNPERYIYPAMKHGVIDPENTVIDMPEAVTAGIGDVSQRGNWNTRATEPYALPTETWREYVHRRRRTLELREKLASGEVHEVDDLVTYNLDIRQLAQDIVEQTDDPAVLRAMYKAVANITVLDPTCGSGAFLFAALEILHPLHDACLDKMRELVNDLPANADPKKMQDFKGYLAQVKKHPNKEYFTLRQIVLNNLYGVDIEEEAVEICKIRLFLTLVSKLNKASEIEPLPDIDFNIRAGNTLVGYVTEKDIQIATGGGQMSMDLDNKVADIRERVELADRAYQHFKRIQMDDDAAVADMPEAKAEYRKRLNDLRDELDGYLHRQQAPGEPRSSWKLRTQPFHWFVEFHQVVVNRGGFDIVFGNPPYLEYAPMKQGYEIHSNLNSSFGNLYALVVERTLGLNAADGKLGFVVPISIVAAQRMAGLQGVLRKRSSALWYLTFALRPAALFQGVMQRITILLASSGKNAEVFSTEYITWYQEKRPHLFEIVGFADTTALSLPYSIPKTGSNLAQNVLEKLHDTEEYDLLMSGRSGKYPMYYHNAGGYWIKAMNFEPYYHDPSGKSLSSSTISRLMFGSECDRDLMLAVVNSSLFYFFWKTLTDARHLYPSDIAMFPVAPSLQCHCKELSALADQVSESIEANSSVRAYRGVESAHVNMSAVKKAIHQIDRFLAAHYGLTDEELDFVMSFDHKYRD